MKIYGFCTTSTTPPIAFYKGEALLRKGYPLYLPNQHDSYVAYPALALRLGRTGKEVTERFAHRYIQAIGAGWDIRNTSLLGEARIHALPWDAAVAFEGSSAALCETYPPRAIPPASHTGQPENLLAPTYTVLSYPRGRREEAISQSFSEKQIRQVVAHLAQYNILHEGDILLLTHAQTLASPCEGVPAYPLSVGSALIASLEDCEDAPCLLRIK